MEEAGTSEDGCQKVALQRPDAVLLALAWPQLKGLVFIKALRYMADTSRHSLTNAAFVQATKRSYNRHGHLGLAQG
jgi:hypothetical protein